MFTLKIPLISVLLVNVVTCPRLLILTNLLYRHFAYIAIFKSMQSTAHTTALMTCIYLLHSDIPSCDNHLHRAGHARHDSEPSTRLFSGVARIPSQRKATNTSKRRVASTAKPPRLSEHAQEVENGCIVYH